jgi:uncharacterized protein (TIGR02271 family)
MTTTANEKLIAAYFGSHADAENAVRDLQKAGFRSDQIGSSYDDYENTSAGVTSAGTRTADHRSFWDKVRDFFSGEPEHHAHTEDYESSGDWGVPESYRDRLNQGGGLITVRAGDRWSEAERILTENHGQIDREFASEWRSSAAGETGERRIQLLSEVLRVHKERVSQGEVRLRKEVRTETQNVQVPVTHEEVVIERTQGGSQTPAAGGIGTEQEIRVPISEERVRVEKVPVVREEVSVRKQPISETQNVADEVRREELNVEGQDEKVKGSVKERKRA